MQLREAISGFDEVVLGLETVQIEFDLSIHRHKRLTGGGEQALEAQACVQTT